MTTPPSRPSGFSLLELSIVLVIVALLLGGLMVPLTAQHESRARLETAKTLNEVRDALFGFAVVNGYLPCPAKSASDGNEDRAVGGTCNKQFGLVPWTTLAIGSGTDAWGRLLGYSVTDSFANSSSRFTLGSKGKISVTTRDGNGNLILLSNKDDVPAVVLSFGKNGHWANLPGSSIVLADSELANPDEDINGGQNDLSRGNPTYNSQTYADRGHLFVSRSTGGDPKGGEFDDLLAWLSPGILMNRMVAAGRLP